MPADAQRRAEIHAALGDPIRLTIVDSLVASDRTPGELGAMIGITSNLLAHHLDTLEAVGLIERDRSHADGRRRYVKLKRGAFDDLLPRHRVTPQRALFVCTHNSARSQLAAALWRRLADCEAESAGTRPAERIHPAAIAAARRAQLDLPATAPRALNTVKRRPQLVITVCDQVHEELAPEPGWLHWSIADPAADPRAQTFDRTVSELRERIIALIEER